MDSKFSFLDQDGLFGDGEISQDPQTDAGGGSGNNQQTLMRSGGARVTNHYGGTSQQHAPPMRPNDGGGMKMQQQQQQQQQQVGDDAELPTSLSLEAILSGPLDGIARALAYTEKRIAASEARVLAALRETTRREQRAPAINGWIIAVVSIICILCVAALFGCFRKPPPSAINTTGGGTATLFLQGGRTMAAPTASSIVFPTTTGLGLAPPPTTFITQ